MFKNHFSKEVGVAQVVNPAQAANLNQAKRSSG